VLVKSNGRKKIGDVEWLRLPFWNITANRINIFLIAESLEQLSLCQIDPQVIERRSKVIRIMSLSFWAVGSTGK